MTKILLLIVLGLAAILSPLRADDITLTDGTVLKNAKIVQRDDSTKTVTISFSGGITQVHSEMLPATPVTAPSPTTPNAANTSTPVSGPATAPSPTLPSLQQNASDYNAQGLDKYTKGDFDGAIADFNQAIALDPKLAEAYNRRGNANRAKGNTDAAIADYQQAIVINPKYANPRNNLGNSKVEKGDLDGAIADYNQAIALDPKLAQAYNNRGIAKRDKGDLDDAISDFKQAIALDPKFTPHPPPDYDSTQEEQSFVDSVRKDAPNINEVIGSFKLNGDTLVVTVTDKYSNSPYQDRLQFAQGIYKRWAGFHNDKSATWVSPLSMIDTGGTQVGGTNASGLWVNSKTDQQAKEQAAAARENKYASLFAFPPEGDPGLLGHVMRIRATFDLQLTPEIVSVDFGSVAVNSYGQIVMGPQYPPIAVYGMPSSFADGSSWNGIVYPAGTITFGMEKYHLYATTKKAAMALLEKQ